MYKIIFLSIVFIALNGYSQKLYTISRDNYNPDNYRYQLLEINRDDGYIIQAIDLNSEFPSLNSPNSLIFSKESNEIIGISDNVIFKFNVLNNRESTIILPDNAFTNYGDLIIANNKLFITSRNYTDPDNYIFSFLQVDINSGEIQNTIELETNLPELYSPESLVFNSSSIEIIGISGREVVIYNIVNNIETSINLPELPFIDYGDLIINENKLLITRRNYNNPNEYIHSLLEIKLVNGAIIDVYDFKTIFSSLNSPESFVFDEELNQIIGISENKIVKLDVNDYRESSFNLPVRNSVKYGDLIFVPRLQALDIEDISLDDDNIISKPIKAYNLLGQEVSVETKNQIIILRYKDGTAKKVLSKG